MGFNSHIPLILFSLSKLSVQKINLKTTKHPCFPPQLHHQFLQNVAYNTQTPKPLNTTIFLVSNTKYTPPQFQNLQEVENFHPTTNAKGLTSMLSIHRNLATKKIFGHPFLGFPIFFLPSTLSLVHSLSFYSCITNFKHFPKVPPLSSSTLCYHPCSLTHSLLTKCKECNIFPQGNTQCLNFYTTCIEQSIFWGYQVSLFLHPTTSYFLICTYLNHCKFNYNY